MVELAASVSMFDRGDLGLVTPLPLALGFRNGEPVRLMPEGVCVLEGGLLGRLIVGLSHDEKKSSSGVGVSVPSDVVGIVMSVMTTSSGYLFC